MRLVRRDIRTLFLLTFSVPPFPQLSKATGIITLAVTAASSHTKPASFEKKARNIAKIRELKIKPIILSFLVISSAIEAKTLSINLNSIVSAAQRNIIK